MNKVFLMGRLTQDPEVRYSSSDSSMAITRYTLAVDRRYAKKDSQTTVDYIRCVAFGKAGEFAGKYFKKGQRVLVEGRIQLGNYDDKDGKKVYTTDIIVEQQEFADSNKNGAAATKDSDASVMDGFLNIEGSTEDDDIPFN